MQHTTTDSWPLVRLAIHFEADVDVAALFPPEGALGVIDEVERVTHRSLPPRQRPVRQDSASRSHRGSTASTGGRRLYPSKAVVGTLAILLEDLALIVGMIIPPSVATATGVVSTAQPSQRQSSVVLLFQTNQTGIEATTRSPKQVTQPISDELSWR